MAAAADVTALIDIASSPDTSPTTPTPAADAADVVDQPTDGATPAAEDTEAGADTPETTPAADADGATPDDKVDARTNPDAIRKALKALRDSSPENAPIARRLNDIVGREGAYRAVFPKVADAKQAKFLLDSIGGGDGLTQLQSTIRSVNETDALLYAGDARVLDSILDDMKAAGKQDAFGKLASPFLDKLADIDPKSYAAALRPHFFESLTKSGLPDMLSAFSEALGATGADGKPAPNVELIKSLVAEMQRWYNAEKTAVEGSRKSAPDPDRQAFEKERSEFQSERQKAFEAEVNGEWNRANNQSLGEALKPYLKLPFAKNWTTATKVSVAREITTALLDELSTDKSYQSQMDAFWSDAKPDKSRILQFHKGKLDLVAQRIVRDVLNARYPGFSSVKGAPAAAAKPGAKPAVAATSAGVKPIFQSTQPKPDTVDWDRTPDTLYATGRFYDRKGVLRTWNAKYK